MTNKLVPLTYAGELYDRTFPIFSGAIQPVGVDLHYLHLDVPDLFWRQSRFPEFDCAEYSMGAYIASVENPDWEYTAIPVFISRAFRHASIYVRPGSGMTSPKDLEGRLIGTPEWSATASLWARGILAEHYGVNIRKVAWRTGGLEQPGRSEKTSMHHLPGYNLEALPADQTLVGAYQDGRLDGILAAVAPGLRIGKDGDIERLFADFRAEEKVYYKATGIFPIMHVVVVRKRLVEAHPWLPNSLKNAFEQAGRYAAGRLLYTGSSVSSLAWEAAYAVEERELFGGDAFAHGVETNMVTLEAMCRYAFDQGFTRRLLKISDLFPASTLSTTYTNR